VIELDVPQLLSGKAFEFRAAADHMGNGYRMKSGKEITGERIRCADGIDWRKQNAEERLETRVTIGRKELPVQTPELPSNENGDCQHSRKCWPERLAAKTIEGYGRCSEENTELQIGSQFQPDRFMGERRQPFLGCLCVGSLAKPGLNEFFAIFYPGLLQPREHFQVSFALIGAAFEDLYAIAQQLAFNTGKDCLLPRDRLRRGAAGMHGFGGKLKSRPIHHHQWLQWRQRIGPIAPALQSTPQEAVFLPAATLGITQRKYMGARRRPAHALKQVDQQYNGKKRQQWLLPLGCRLLVGIFDLFFILKDGSEDFLDGCTDANDEHHDELPQLRQQAGLERNRRSAADDESRQSILGHLVARNGSPTSEY